MQANAVIIFTQVLTIIEYFAPFRRKMGGEAI